jgi:NADP-dependent 3-hydroxy acid dehydrogenase YdfG
VISPGAAATELPNSVTDPEAAERIQTFYAQTAIAAESFTRAVAFATSQPGRGRERDPVPADASGVVS